LTDAVPLLTLLGPGGVGKTRLALAVAGDVAESFADGVIWVDLAPLQDPELVLATIATALGVVPAANIPVIQSLTVALRPRQTLLLLDNCEHVLDVAATAVAVLLATCPAVQILATSRAPLHVRGEQQFPVDPLPLPPFDDASLAAITENEAVRLFAVRARAVQFVFQVDETNATTVAALCRRLEGVPLAIELAAAHSKVLPPDVLLAQMSDRLRLLSGGARDLPARQQTMTATIRWSYDLLAPDAQALFRRLSVFVGGWTLAAAQAVADASPKVPAAHEMLTTLVDQSLVRRVDQVTEPRFAMLETLRIYGLEQLAQSDEEPAAR
jgi:predicted ATPase